MVPPDPRSMSEDECTAEIIATYRANGITDDWPEDPQDPLAKALMAQLERICEAQPRLRALLDARCVGWADEVLAELAEEARRPVP